MEPMTWYALAMMAASILISVALAPKPAQPKPQVFDDSNMPQVKEGTPQPVVFGETWTGDWQVLATGNYRTSAVKAKQAKK